MPLWQVSICVHALPSLQLVPCAATGFERKPVDGPQVPAGCDESAAAQPTAFPPTQEPDWQVSLCVQASLSLQAVPSVRAGSEHLPVDGSHVPAAWHWSVAVQVTGFEPTHE